jgi:dihydroxyacetone kinase-like predicted kinase
MLPVLKKAGVVDAGGQGLIVIFEGMASVLTGKASSSRSKRRKPTPIPSIPTATRRANMKGRSPLPTAPSSSS